MIRDYLSQYILTPIGKTYSNRDYFKAKAYQKILEENQSKSSDELQHDQDSLLIKMIQHAYENVPYYRALFQKAGISPSDIRTKDDLKVVPFLTKDILVRNIDNLVARNIKRSSLKLVPTGGTTGTPITFYRYQNVEYKIDGSNWRFFKFCGYETGMRIAQLWGNEKDLLNSMNLHGKLKSIMDNEILLNFYDLSDQRLINYVNIIKKKKPKFWKGFSSAVYMFMRYIKKNGIDIPLPKAIIITGDKIDDSQRAELDSFFNNTIFNEYGCREFSIIGFECDVHEGIHVGMENVVVEIMPSAIGDDYGEVVVTSLINWGMPFIRYKLRDASKFLNGSCKCGRNLPRLESIKGRIADFVVTKSNKLIYGEFFAHLLYETKGIEHYRAIQKEAGKVTLYLEKNEFYNDKEVDIISNRFIEMTHGDLELDLSVVSKIDMHESGKRRPVISEISKDYLL